MVPFFGIETPTPQAAAVMAIKWNVPIYMVRVERFKGIKFKLSVEDELKFPKNLDKDKATYEITRLISKRIEEWIIDRPEQWLWAHRRGANRVILFSLVVQHSTRGMARYLHLMC